MRPIDTASSIGGPLRPVSRIRAWSMAMVLALSSCAGDVISDPPSTGLQGVMTRGPITPVCREGVPCDAPFAADFDVRNDRQVVTSFRSDSAGRFLVLLYPGDYTIVPNASAPLSGAVGQTRAVTVGKTGITRRDLSFDTGIR